MAPPGWVVRPGKAFNTYVGPFYQLENGDSLRCGFVTDERHGNKRGVTHGGMLATAFDVALGNASWDAAGQKPCATVQLNIHYVGALNLHEFAEIAIDVVRTNSELGVPARDHDRGRPDGRNRGWRLENPELARRTVRESVSFSRAVSACATWTSFPRLSTGCNDICPQDFVVLSPNSH